MSVISLTEAAANKVRQLIERDGRAGYNLRLKVVGGGCSGLQYQLMFDDKVGDWDQKGEEHGVGVVVDSKSAVYLLGTKIDYVDDLNGAGFKIENPNATSTCGCGQSFGALSGARRGEAAATRTTLGFASLRAPPVRAPLAGPVASDASAQKAGILPRASWVSVNAVSGTSTPTIRLRTVRTVWRPVRRSIISSSIGTHQSTLCSIRSTRAS